MLQDVKIAGEALDAVKPINLIFPTNGAGKTNISRVIACPDRYASCSVSWKQVRDLARRFNQALLRAEIDRLSARLAVNKRLLEAKKREPSAPVALEPLEDAR